MRAAGPCADRRLRDVYAPGPRSFRPLGPDGPAVRHGSVRLVASSPQGGGGFSFGGFGAADYLTFGAPLRAAWSGLDRGGVDFWWRPSSLRTGRTQTPFAFQDSWLRRTVIRADGPDGAYPAVSGAYPAVSGTAEGAFHSRVSMTAGAWNELTLLWDSRDVYLYVNGRLGYRGYGLQWRTGAVGRISLGADLVDGKEGAARDPATGCLARLGFLTAPLRPPMPDGCGAAPRPTLTPFQSFRPTPTPGATAVPQCWPRPRLVLTIAASPVVTPIPTPPTLCNVAEPDLALYPRDPQGNVVHISYSWENNRSGASSIRLVTSTGLFPSGNGLLTPARDRGVLVGQGVLGVNDWIHGSEQVHVSDRDDRLYWGDGTDGNVWEADSADGGYHYRASTVRVACRVSQWDRLYWYPGTDQQLYTMAVARDPHDPAVWWGIVEMDNRVAYGPMPYDLLWLVKSTDGARTFRPASPLPLMGALCAGPGIIAQGPRALDWNAAGGYWDLWESVSYEGPLWHLRSPDLYNWTCDRSAGPTKYQIPTWAPRNDQVADVSGGVEYGGYWWFAATQADNTPWGGASFLFWYPGTQEDYSRCSGSAFRPR